jgi:DNA-binding response OmpR family regulator
MITAQILQDKAKNKTLLVQTPIKSLKLTTTPEPQTVYIFDDDPDILFICEVVLRNKGYTIHSSPNCNDIVNKIKQVGADIILLDNKIPPEGGIVAARQILSDAGTKEIPIVYFSANTQVEKLSLEAGAKYFIQKPFDISKLEEIIELALVANQRAS